METGDHTSFNHYRERCQQLGELCKRLSAVLEPLNVQALVGQWAKLKQEISAEALTILVAGGVGWGKSTLIRALLSQHEYLNAQAQVPLLFYEVGWGEGPGSALHFHPFDSSLRNLLYDLSASDDVSLPANNHHERDAGEHGLAFAMSYASSVEIASGVGPYDQDWYPEEEAIRALPSADAVLFVLACDVLPSREELLEIDRITCAGCKSIFFLCNRFDRVEPFSQAIVKRRFESRLELLTLPDDRRVFFTNAKGALMGHRSDDIDQLRQSQIPSLEDALYSFLVAERGRERLLLYAAGMKRTAGEVLHLLQIQEQLLHVDPETLRDHAGRAHNRLKQLEEMRHHLVTLFMLAHRSLRAKVSVAVANFYLDSADVVEGWVREYKSAEPLSGWDVFAGHARERLLKEITTFLTAKIQARFVEWGQATLLPLLTERLQQLEQELDEHETLLTDELKQVWDELGGKESAPHPVSEAIDACEMGKAERGRWNGGDDWIAQARQMMRNASAHIVSLVYERLCFAWHPLVLIERLEKAEELQALIASSASQTKVRKAVGQEYRRELLNSYSPRVDVIMEIMEHELRLLREEVDRALGLKMQMVCDMVITLARQSERKQRLMQESEMGDKLNMWKCELESVSLELDALSAVLQSEGLGLSS